MFSQQRAIDSLHVVLKGINERNRSDAYTISDTTKVKTLINLSSAHFLVSQNAEAMSAASEARSIVERILPMAESKYVPLLNKLLANALNGMATIQIVQGNYPKADELLSKALELRTKISDEVGMAQTINLKGVLYKGQGEHLKALEQYRKALAIYEKRKDKKGMAMAFNNMGTVFNATKQYDKAFEYYEKALKIRKELGDKQGMATTYGNLGNNYHSKNNLPLALEYQTRSLLISKELGNKKKQATAYINIVGLYHARVRAKEVTIHEVKDKIRDCLNEVMVLLEGSGDKELYKEAYLSFSNFEGFLGNSKKSLEYYKFHIQYRDSISNEESLRRSAQAELGYEFERKEAAAKLEQEKKDALAIQDRQTQKLIRNTFITGFLAMLILAIFIFRVYKQKQIANNIISSQKLEVERQKISVEQKQSQILDSINYAKRIQDSILISESEIKRSYKEMFVLYLPKDIVSGDFYWFTKQGEVLLIAAGDCTGHGVPGAFLSMVGSTLLNEIVAHNGITDPADIIQKLAAGVSTTLINKDKEEVNTDGMDISVCKIDPKNKQVLFAGANHPLYVVNRSGFKRIESQINSIYGIFELENNVPIESVALKAEPDTMFYMTTDGYADQIGEKSMKKFMTTRLEALLKEIHMLPLEEQKMRLSESFNDWKGKMNQVDDVLVIGFRI